YYVRNGIGEFLTSWLDGVSNPKYYRGAQKAMMWAKGENKNLAELIEKWEVLGTAINAPTVDGGQTVGRLANGTKISAEEGMRQYYLNGLNTGFVNLDLKHG